MTNLLLRLRLHHAAKRYARRLGPALTRAYGLSERYTPAQIRAAVSKQGLNPEYIALGYAAFLPEDVFASLASEMPVFLPYDGVRELLARFQSAGRFRGSDHYESGLGMTGGLDGSSL